jgi:hypothetical protein
MPQNEPNPQISDASTVPSPYAGPALTAWQYEALCRHALSCEYGVLISNIKTGYLEGATKTDQKVRHQIDLYWTVCDGVCNFLCIANAKYRKNKVSQTEIMTLLGVQRDIHAHKAMMITNTGYSHGALVHAGEKGIALLIVRPSPDFNFSHLPEKPAPAIASELERFSKHGGPLFNLDIIHRGFELRRGSAQAPAAPTSAGPFPRPGPAACPEPSPEMVRPVPQSAFSNQHSAIPPRPLPNRMIPSSPPAPRAPAPFGIRRKGI